MRADKVSYLIYFAKRREEKNRYRFDVRRMDIEGQTHVGSIRRSRTIAVIAI